MKIIERITEDHMILSDQMLETMYSQSGVGLAAPQIGIDQRMMVMDCGSGPKTLINPEIIESSEEVKKNEEGCLSFPGFFVQIERPISVTVRYSDLDGQMHEEEFTGFDAVCVQHEIDHLDGKTILDRIPRQHRHTIQDAMLKERMKRGY